jgi:anti-sigma factor RsiW
MSNAKHVTDSLSAYLDNQLSAGERARVGAHLRTCDRCQADLESLRYTQRVLRAMPEIRAPRSFALTPEQGARALPRWQAGWGFRFLQGATALAAVLLLAVVGLDAFVLNSARSFSASAPAPAARLVATAVSVPAAADAATNESKVATGAPSGAQAPAAATNQPGNAAGTAAAAATVAPVSPPESHTPTTFATHIPVVSSAGASDTPSSPPTTTPPPTNTRAPTATATRPPTATATATHTATAAPSATPVPRIPAETATPPNLFGLRLIEISLLALVLLGTSALVMIRIASR